MNNDQFIICFIMAIVFIIANDSLTFIIWYVLYSESLVVDNFLWWEWTSVFMAFYIVIRMIAVRFGWMSKSRFLPDR